MADDARRAGRPSLISSEKKTHEILEVATREFVKRGYADTSIGTIANLAGVSKPTVYAKFKSKSGLLRKVIEFAIDKQLPADDNLGPFDKSVEGLVKILEEIIKSSTSNLFLGIFGLYLSESGKRPEVFDAFYESMVERTEAPLIRHLCKHPGLCPGTKPEIIARMLLSMTSQLVMLACTRPGYRDTVTPKEDACQIVRIVLYGIVPRD